MAPMKDAVLFKDLRWSKWVESMRKDVECTFGIMKGRFRILKIGIRLQSIDAVDKLWCTCCALHNMFLEDDGLSVPWETGAIGLHNKKDSANQAYDASGMGYGTDNIALDEDVDLSESINADIDNISMDEKSNAVFEMGCYEFRQKLIDHFNILYDKDEIKWPTLKGTKDPSNM